MVASCKLLYCIKGLVWLSWFHKFSMSWSCNVWGTSWVARWLWRNCTYDCSRPGKDQQMVWSAVQFGPWGIYLQDGLDLLGSRLQSDAITADDKPEAWDLVSSKVPSLRWYKIDAPHRLGNPFSRPRNAVYRLLKRPKCHHEGWTHICKWRSYFSLFNLNFVFLSASLYHDSV